MLRQLLSASILIAYTLASFPVGLHEALAPFAAGQPKGHASSCCCASAVKCGDSCACPVPGAERNDGSPSYRTCQKEIPGTVTPTGKILSFPWSAEAFAVVMPFAGHLLAGLPVSRPSADLGLPDKIPIGRSANLPIN